MANNAPSFSIRKYPAHTEPVTRFNEPIILFVTVCVLDGAAILANDSVHNVLRGVWPKATHWWVGPYLIMPDHVHLLCTPAVHDPLSIKRWVEFWKYMCSQKAPTLTGNLQRGCWDTQMRSQEHYDEKLAYMRENPVRAGLATQLEMWPYQGSLNEIRW